jgi:hypothetical protein
VHKADNGIKKMKGCVNCIIYRRHPACISIVLTKTLTRVAHVCPLAVCINDHRKHAKSQAESNTVHSNEQDQYEADQQVLSSIVSKSDLLLNVHCDRKGAGPYDVISSSAAGSSDEMLLHCRNTGNAGAYMQCYAYSVLTSESFRCWALTTLYACMYA